MLHKLVWKNRHTKILILVMVVIISSFSCIDFQALGTEAPAVREKTTSIIKSSIGLPLIPVASDDTGQKYTEPSTHNGNGIRLRVLRNSVSVLSVSFYEFFNENRESKVPLYLFCENSENLKIVNYLHDSDGMKG